MSSKRLNFELLNSSIGLDAMPSRRLSTPLVVLLTVCFTWLVLNVWTTTNHYHSDARIQMIITQKFATNDAITLAKRDDPVSAAPTQEEEERSPAPTQEEAKPPAEAVYLVKVHKAASTSIQMILYRYGVVHDSKFASYNRKWGMPYPEKALDSLLYEDVTDSNFSPIDIMNEHAIYDEEVVRSYMKPGYKLIGSLREPLSQIKSYMSFFKVRFLKDRYQSIDDNLRAFIHDPEKYKRHPRSSFLKNCQAQHFGFNSYENQDNITQFIDYIDKKFDLILISEQLDESLLLMKRKFNWSLNDIMYLSRHVYASKMPQPSSEKRLEDRLKRMHRGYSNVDYEIYNHFSRKLQDELNEQPSDYWQELDYYKTIKDQLNAFCSSKCESILTSFENYGSSPARHLMGSTVFSIPGRAGEKGSELTYTDCVLLSMSTQAWQKTIRTTQHQDLFCNVHTLSMNQSAAQYYNPRTQQVYTDRQDLVKHTAVDRCDSQRFVAYAFTDTEVLSEMRKFCQNTEKIVKHF